MPQDDPFAQGRLRESAEAAGVTTHRLCRSFFPAVALCAVAACSGTPAVTAPPASNPARQYIKHVVIVIQENRSFDNLFAGFPGADAPRYGYAGSKRVPLRATPLENRGDIENNWRDAIAGWNHGKMNGFEHEHFYGGPRDFAYAFVPRAESAPYWTLARRYVLADRMFPTEFGPSYTAHLSLIAANTTIEPSVPIAEVDAPDTLKWGCEAPPGARTFTLDVQRVERFNGPFPCYSHFPTIARRLDAAGVSWKYYAAPLRGIGEVWSEFSSVRDVYYGADWKNVISPQTRVLRDAAAGTLADVSWVTPDWKDSDHTGSGSNRGPSWVTAVVNAIGESRNWSSTAIFLLWDDWGGWYDDVPPPQLDFRGLGIRVPCIVISPYAKSGYVSHTQYEYGSILKFVESVFGLPPVGPPSRGFTDTRAADMLDAFDFTQAPRAFVPISAPYAKAAFLHERPSVRAAGFAIERRRGRIYCRLTPCASRRCPCSAGLLFAH